MKTSTCIASAFAGLLLGSLVGVASASSSPVASVPIVEDAPLVIELPAESPVVVLPRVVIVGHVPQRAVATKVWSCSAPEGMLQGPATATVRSCGWR